MMAVFTTASEIPSYTLDIHNGIKKTNHNPSQSTVLFEGWQGADSISRLLVKEQKDWSICFACHV